MTSAPFRSVSRSPSSWSRRSNPPPAPEAPRVVYDARPAPVAAARAPVARSEKHVEVENKPFYRIESDRSHTIVALNKSGIVGTYSFVREFLNKGRPSDDQIFVLEESDLPEGYKITEEGLVIAPSSTATVALIARKDNYKKWLQEVEKKPTFDSVINRLWELEHRETIEARFADCASTASIKESWATLRSPQLAFLRELEKFHHGRIVGEPEILEPLFKALQQAEPQFSYSNR